ncbi:MAG TPA: Spy/CpxP family protein refolding chaperone [Gemmatimonadaceae bacterium]|nr:Spy/CpxP family protein refolding chaperone [Gemmatimonadaceae bacterium]
MTRMGLGLALVVGAAGAAAAQSTRPDNRPDSTHQKGERGDRGDRGMRRRGDGGPEGALLKGITLTDAQKTRLKTLREEQRTETQKTREQFGAAMKEARDARQRGDTVAARAKMEQVRAGMEKQRERQVASLRTILTAEQQKQLDANVAEWKDRAAKGGHRERGGQPRTGTGNR